jgi:hypothetical protein
MSCARCGAEASQVAHPLELVFCSSCMTLWLREPTCSLEAVCIAAGLPVVYAAGGASSYQGRTERFDAELLRRTREWISKPEDP